ncbi:hypothetical protein PHET_11703 [Paragonimus heterotremus]|uniref:Uncharacterized protein n=1 Tax=Paragonimus heterotremus TaxID=100268 RepID=A0A8J4SKX0_9TREM|nr:hypothetical protein PHET_11703 [Paragonimus heterotremus]
MMRYGVLCRVFSCFGRPVVRFISDGNAFEYITFSKVGAAGNVGFIRLNRPKALNALCAGLMGEVSLAVNLCEADDHIKSVVLTGNNNAFAGKHFLVFIVIRGFNFPNVRI